MLVGAVGYSQVPDGEIVIRSNQKVPPYRRKPDGKKKS